MEAILSSVTDPAELLKSTNPKLPYRFDRIFDVEGFWARRLAKKRLKLMKAVDADVQQILADNEKVEFVTWGAELSGVETLVTAFWSWLKLPNRRAIVITDQRILLLHVSAFNRPLRLKRQIRHRAVGSLKLGLLGTPQFVLNDKMAISFVGLPRKDRRTLCERVAARRKALKSEAPVAGRENLCPHCGIKNGTATDRCRSCAGGFKSGTRAGWLSFAFPGLGSFYLGHRGLGLLWMSMALLVWTALVYTLLAGFELLPDFVPKLATLQLPEGLPLPVPEPILLSVLAGVVVVILHGGAFAIARRMGLRHLYPAD